MTTPDDLAQAIDTHIDGDARSWMDRACRAITTDPTAIRSTFPAVPRTVGRTRLVVEPAPGWTVEVGVDDIARARLIACLPTASRAEEVADLYRYGDAGERIAVLRSLDLAGVPEEMASTAGGLVADALRTNDTRLVAAALGPAGVALLDDAELPQAVLKCVFTGIGLDRVADLPGRVTPELSRMMADFVHERIAAGRDVPAEVWPIIDAYPPADRLAAITAELDHPSPDRARAARTALDQRG